jgi:hypothetical protein
MTQEQKEYLKDIVKFKTINPFENKDYEAKRLQKLRDEALEAIGFYKQYKKDIEQRKKEDEKINDLLKAIDNL